MQNNAAIVTMALSVASFMRPPEPLILAQKQASRKTLETPLTRAFSKDFN